MKDRMRSIREVSQDLELPTHVVAYAVSSGKVKEPLRVSGRRMFSETDIAALRKVLKKGAK